MPPVSVSFAACLQMGLRTTIHGAVLVRFVQTVVLLEHEALDQILPLRKRWVLPARAPSGNR